MPAYAGDTLKKALRLLDQGQLVKGERTLMDALTQAELEHDCRVEVNALLTLADLRLQQGRRREAQPYLSRLNTLQLDTQRYDYELRLLGWLNSTL